MPKPKYVKKYVDKYKKLFSSPTQSVSSSGTSAPVPDSSNGINLNAIEAYFNDRLVELQSMAVRGDAWFFASCCTFLDILTWCAFFNDIVSKAEPRRFSQPTDFTKFLDHYFLPANPKYGLCWRSLQGPAKNKSMSWILYENLRCGSVHSFSMKQTMKPDDDGYSILLAHYHDFNDVKNHHLEIVDTYMDAGKPAIESIILIAEDFITDVRRCTEKLFSDAHSDNTLESSIIELFKNKPPMGFLNIDLVR